jgi:hypothetical protein
MQLDDAAVRPSVGACKTTALKGLLWVVVLAATFLAVGAILFLVYALLEATRPT